MNWRLGAVLFLAGVLAGAVPVSCHKDAQYDRLVQRWKADTATYFAEGRVHQQVVAGYVTAIAIERRRNALRDSAYLELEATAARLEQRKRPPAPFEIPDTVRMVPVTLVRQMRDNLVEQIAIRDSLLELREAQRDTAVAARASLEWQLTDMTSIAVIQQVRRADCEALLKKAPVNPRKPHLSVLAEVQATTTTDSLTGTVRLGLSAQVKNVAVEGGVQQELNGPRAAFVRVSLKKKLL